MAWCSVKAQGQLYFYIYLVSGKFRIEFLGVFTGGSPANKYNQLANKTLDKRPEAASP
jgi:hypothetical protein